MKLSLSNLQKYTAWEQLAVSLPLFSVEEMVLSTKKAPSHLHFGGGDAFRGLVASVQQRCLNRKLCNTGIIVVDTPAIIEKIYRPYDNLSLSVLVGRTGVNTYEIIASVAEALSYEEFPRLREIIACDSLEIFSFTLGAEAYVLREETGAYLPNIAQDIVEGPNSPQHSLAIVASLLYTRFQKGGKPLTLLSLEDLEKNGQVLKVALLEIVRAWQEAHLVDEEFIHYLDNSRDISFPLTMVDKIIPPPLSFVERELQETEIEDMVTLLVDGKLIAPFFNCQREQYLIYEDKFPNGHPPFEVAGVRLLKHREVRQIASAKISCGLPLLECACVIFAQLFELPTMERTVCTRDILTLLQELLYEECLPIYEDVSFFVLEDYLDDIFQKRLPHAIMQVSPTIYGNHLSSKLAQYLGKTLKSYRTERLDTEALTAIPFLVAAWFRYAMGFSDRGQPFSCGQDSRLAQVQVALRPVKLGRRETYQRQLLPFLQDKTLFDISFVAFGLEEKIEEYYKNMIMGSGAVASTLTRAMDAFVVGDK